MELSLYFDNTSVVEMIEESSEHTFGKNVVCISDDIIPTDVDVVILGVPEDRNSLVSGSADGPALVREELYKLRRINGFEIADLGNLKIGKTVDDTYVALSEIIAYLNSLEITTVLMGGSQDLILAVLDGIGRNKKDQQIKFINIDSTLDIKDNSPNAIGTHNFLTRAYREKTVDVANVGYQKQLCLTEKYVRNKIENLSLGSLRDDFMLDAEPIIRESDVVGIDMGVLKAADFMAVEKPNSNGLCSEELCKLMVFSGVSASVSCVGLFNYLPKYDSRNVSSFVLAQAIWYFCESYMFRVNEHPENEEDLFKKYIVSIDDADIVSTFYQSEITGRFWFEVLDDLNGDATWDEHKYMPCTDFDFEEANKGNITSRIFYYMTKGVE